MRWARRDSNPRLLPCKNAASPATWRYADHWAPTGTQQGATNRRYVGRMLASRCRRWHSPTTDPAPARVDECRDVVGQLMVVHGLDAAGRGVKHLHFDVAAALPQERGEQVDETGCGERRGGSCEWSGLPDARQRNERHAVVGLAPARPVTIATGPDLHPQLASTAPSARTFHLRDSCHTCRSRQALLRAMA